MNLLYDFPGLIFFVIQTGLEKSPACCDSIVYYFVNEGVVQLVPQRG